MYNYKRREVDKIMKNNGYYPHHQTGSHVIYKNSRGEHISVGASHGQCNGAIIHKLGKKHGLDVVLH